MSGNHQEESVLPECGPQVVWVDRPWIPGQTQWGGGGGAAEEERRGGGDHRKSTSAAEEEKGNVGRRGPGGRGEARCPHLSGRACTRWTQSCGLVGRGPVSSLPWPSVGRPCRHSVLWTGEKAWEETALPGRLTLHPGDFPCCFSALSLSPLTEFYLGRLQMGRSP